MKNRIASALGTRLITLMFTFAINVISAHVLRPADRGHFAVMIAIPSFISAFGVIGLDTANLYFAGTSDRAFRFIVRWSLLYGALGGAFLSSAYALLAAIWPSLRLGLSHSQFGASTVIGPLALIVSLLGVAEAGRGRIIVFNISVLASTMAYLMVCVAAILDGRADVQLLYIGFAISQFVAFAILLISSAPWKNDEGQVPELSTYLRYGGKAFTLNTLQFLMLRLDIPMIQVLAGSTAVGLYSVAYPMAETLALIAVAVNLVLLPDVARSLVKHNGTWRLAILTFGGSLAYSLVIGAIAPYFIPHVFGEQYRNSIGILWVLLPGAVILNFGRVLQSYFTGSRRFEYSIVSSLIAFVVMAVLEFLLIPQIGAIGAAAASTFAYSLFTFGLAWRFYQEDPESVRRSSIHRILLQEVSAAIRSASALGLRIRRAGVNRREAMRTPFSSHRIVRVALPLLGATLIGIVASASPLSFIVVLALVLNALVILYPRIGLMALAALAPLSVLSVNHSTASSLLVTIILGATLMGLMIHQGLWTVQNIYQYLLVAGYFVFSWLYGAERFSSHGNLRKELLIVLSIATPILLIPLYPHDRKLARLNLTIMVGSIVVVAGWYVINGRHLLAGVASDKAWIVVSGASNLGNHNVIGSLVILAIAVVLPRIGSGISSAQRIVLLAALMLLLIGGLFSFSRSTYGALPVMFAFFACRRGLKGIALFVGALAVGDRFLPDSVRQRILFTTSGAGGGLDTSSTVRLDLWHSAFATFLGNPILGVGLYQFKTVLPSYWVSRMTSGADDASLASIIFAHNTPLTIASQLGMIGALLLGWLTISMALDARRARSSTSSSCEGETALLAIIGIGVASLFGEPLFAAAVLIPFVLIVAASRQVEFTQ